MLQFALRAILIAALYAVAGRLALTLAVPPGFASPLWLPAGLALAAILKAPKPALLGIWLGSVLTNLAISPPDNNNWLTWAVPAIIAIGACLQAKIAALLLQRWVALDQVLEKAAELGKLLLIGGPLSCLFNASWSTGFLMALNIVEPQQFFSNWSNWWLGDSVGVVILTPLILLWMSPVGRQRRWLITTPVMGVLLLAIAVFFIHKHDEEQRLQTEFSRRAEQQKNNFDLNIARYNEIIFALRDFFSASDEVTRDDFRQFTRDMLKRQRGLVALSWNPIISETQRHAFEQARRAQGFSDFQIRELNEQRELVAAQPALYHIVVDYIEPFDGNRRALGYDVNSDLERSHTFAQAQKLDTMIITPPIKLVQYQNQQMGFLAMLPVYQRHNSKIIAGFVVGVFTYHDLFSQSLALSKNIAHELRDITDSDKTVLLFSSLSQTKDYEANYLQWQEILEWGGRRWQLLLKSPPKTFYANFSQEPFWVLLFGLLATCAVNVFMLLLTAQSQKLAQTGLELEHKQNLLEQKIVEREQALNELREIRYWLNEAEKIGGIGAWTRTPNSEYIKWSESQYRLFGLPNDTPITVSRFLECVHPDDRDHLRVVAKTISATGGADVQYRIIRPDGETRWLHSVSRLVENDQYGKSRIFGVVHDITELWQQQNRINKLARLHALLSSVNAIMLRTENRDEVLHQICQITVAAGGYVKAWIGWVQADKTITVVAGCGVANTPIQTGFTLQQISPQWCPVQQALQQARIVVCEDAQDCPLSDELQQTGLPEKAVISLPLIIDGSARGVLVLHVAESGHLDEEELKMLEDLAADVAFALTHIERQAKINHLAYYDALTDLPNATLFHDRLTQFLTLADANGRVVVLLLIDIDHFKQVNDGLGRIAGDHLLKWVAQQLSSVLLEPYSLARVGADTFAVAVADLPIGSDATTILRDRIFKPLKNDFVHDEHRLHINVRVGVALYPDDGQNAENLYLNAEAALKQAKNTGEKVAYYAPTINARMAERLALETRLHEALSNQEFVLYFQPRVDLNSGLLISAEALLRWKHPQQGVLSPFHFVPLAEETGFIVDLGNWVINEACRQLSAWTKEGIQPVPISINVSAMQVKHGGLSTEVSAALLRHQVPPQLLEVELTETAVMQNIDHAIHDLRALSSQGIRLALDDFGTGYSSLAYLKRFPFHTVKIDRSFVTDVVRNPEDAAIATAVIAMAHQLRLRVVAEGVETEEQLHFLRAHRCDEVQGYLFSPPVPAAAFTAMLSEVLALPNWPTPTHPVQQLLIVDDEPGMRSALNRLFRRAGFNVLIAADGNEALDLMARCKPRVVISDLQMPGMSGIEFFRRARALYPDTMRILLSGYTELETLLQVINEGAVYKVLTKPWDDEQLVEQVRDAFMRYRPL